jgi:transposase InsO family protein
VGRTSYYCPRTIRTKTDELAASQILAANAAHPFYGVRRLAIHLGWSENKTRRIRTLAGIVIPTASKKRRHGKSAMAEITAPANALKVYATFRNEARPQDGMDYSGMTNSGGWVQDFTHLVFDRQEHYLAVVLDLKTRQVVGWKLGLNHSSQLTYEAVLDALSKHPVPTILHSDQGSEYLSHKHQLLCAKMEITLSCSTKASPWQNGFMERWFGNYKLELGNINKHEDLAHLHEAIALQMHYYNTQRIHTALRMSPAAYAARLKTSVKRDKVFAEMGA